MMRRAATRGDCDENALDSLSTQIFRKEGAASEVVVVVWSGLAWSCRGVRLQEKALWDNALGLVLQGRTRFGQRRRRL